jgi:cysteine synthase
MRKAPKPFKSIIKMITNTPMKQLTTLSKGHGGNIFAKLEYMNPGGSVKDRLALATVLGAKERGILKPGQTVVECTSGNTGAGLAVVCSALGHPFIAYMSEGNSPERRRIIEALGAEIILVPQIDGTPGKVTGKDIFYADDMCKKDAIDNGYWYVDQFNNPDGIDVHENTTGKEIWEQMEGKVDAFCASVGSAGQFVGASRYLKKKNPDIKCFAVEPENAAILSTGEVTSGKHIIQGTGYSIVPPKFDFDICDGIITVSDKDCRHMTQQVSRKEGCYTGYSGGANVWAAQQIMKQFDKEVNVATILCDSAFKYSDL